MNIYKLAQDFATIHSMVDGVETRSKGGAPKR